jgi:tellurite methyltransferase
MDFRLFNRELGNADLFLIDLILKGTFKEGKKILDAGCGEGRNLDFFLRNDFDVYGADKNISALRMLNYKLKTTGRSFNEGHFIQSDLADLSFENDFFDYIICLSVMHFAESDIHFMKMFKKMIALLIPGGFFFLGMNSVFGIEHKVINSSAGLYRLPEGELRYLLNDSVINAILADGRIRKVEPLRSVIVHGYETRSYLLLEKIS